MVGEACKSLRNAALIQYALAIAVGPRRNRAIIFDSHLGLLEEYLEEALSAVSSCEEGATKVTENLLLLKAALGTCDLTMAGAEVVDHCNSDSSLERWCLLLSTSSVTHIATSRSLARGTSICRSGWDLLT